MKGAVLASLFFLAAHLNATELSPLFKVGRPAWKSFSITASGYGALGEDRAHVAVYVSARESKQVRVGAAVTVRLGAPTELTTVVEGRVTSVLRDADPSTGQAIVSIKIPVQTLPARTYASASIDIGAHRALSIPNGALIVSDGLPFVFRMKGENDFEKTPVTIGAQTSDAIEIENGLAPNDRILIEGAVEWAHKDKDAGDGD
jgi:multidrug efflux pump subunit AcrA (membrane-fusion protein)